MKIALHGSYYARNFGDTLIIKIMADWIKEACFECEIVLPNIYDDVEAKEIGARAINDDEWETVDAVVFSGGGYFGEPNVGLIKRYYWYLRNWQRHLSWYNKIKNKNIVIFGLVYGPLKNKLFRVKVNELLENAKFVFVRDGESYEYLKRYGYLKNNIYKSVDLAISIGLNRRLSDDQGFIRSKIALHLPIDNKCIAKPYAELLSDLYDIDDIEVIRDIKSSKKQVPDYVYLNREIGERKIKVIDYPGVDKFLDLISQYKVIITSKLHVGIVATNMGIPVYSIPSHHKTIRYYRQIDYLYNCNPIYRFDKDKHRDVMNNILELKKAKISEKVYKEVKRNKDYLFRTIREI